MVLKIYQLKILESFIKNAKLGGLGLGVKMDKSSISLLKHHWKLNLQIYKEENVLENWISVLI